MTKEDRNRKTKYGHERKGNTRHGEHRSGARSRGKGNLVFKQNMERTQVILTNVNLTWSGAGFLR